MINKICVVGNTLKEFSKNISVFTAKEFMDLLHLEENILDAQNHYDVHLGQGLDDKSRTLIFNKIRESRLHDRFAFSGIDEKTQRAIKQMTHKEKRSNTLISVPEKIGDNTYKSLLMIDENCADLSDHLSGQHIQAMVLIEAVRQMVNAVVEHYMLTSDQKGNVGFVLNTFQSTFHQYVFPFEVQMIYDIQKVRKMQSGDLMATVVIKIVQNEQVCVEVELKHSVINKDFITKKESEMAVDSLKKLMATEKATTCKSF